MKHFFILIFLVSATVGNAQEAKWFTDFDKAKKTAKRQGKPILMYFTGSDWCGPCKMLKKDFWQSEKFLAQADDFVLLEIDIPFKEDIISPAHKAKNLKLQSKYNKDKSFPTVLALDSNGNRRDEISAYSMLRDTAPYFNFIEKAKSLR